MTKKLFVCILYDDIIRPTFVKTWTTLHEQLVQQKFTVSISFGIGSLQSVTDEFDYILVLNSNTMFEYEHFASLYYKMYDKDILGGIIPLNNNFLHCIETVEKGEYMKKEDIEGKETPIKVDAASFDWVLLKKTTFEHLRKQETYSLIPFTTKDKDGKEVEDVLPLLTSIFIHLKKAGMSCWVDPSVQLKQLVLTII
jgi:hypothetical protein